MSFMMSVGFLIRPVSLFKTEIIDSFKQINQWSPSKSIILAYKDILRTS